MYTLHPRLRFLPFVPLALIAACESAPYAPPPALETQSVPVLAGGEPVRADWWRGFDDPLLAGLVEAALAGNRDLLAGDAGLVEAEALLRQVASQRSVSTLSRADAELARPPGEDRETDFSVSGSLSANWEVDAFGRIEALVEAGQFDVEAARQIRRDIAVAVAAETALAYTDWRGNAARLEVARRNASAQKEGLDLIRRLLENGRATQLDVERAEAQYRTTLASLPVFRAGLEEAAARLSALTAGAARETLLVREATDDPLSAVPELRAPLATGTVESLLRRRPDIRLAEARLGRAVALTEAARADLFPTVTLGASALALFDETDALTRSTSLGFGLGPAISWAGPDLRAVRASIDAADARADGALAVYEQTVLDALADVEAALSAYAAERARRADLIAAAESAEAAFELADLRFREGIDDYLDVLDAQRTLLDAQDRLVSSRVETTRRAIRAYRSLGGIWDDAALQSERTGS